MSSNWGSTLHISIFGESHGPAIGVVIDGLVPGKIIDLEELGHFMQRRAPGKDKLATKRKEADLPRIVSGLFNGVTTGTPVCAIIENSDTRSGDYQKMMCAARPGHADYTGFVHYHGFNDTRGGGHFSGRLTAPLVFAGGVCKQLLSQMGVEIAAHILSIGDVHDIPFDPVQVDEDILKELLDREFPLLEPSAELAMRDCVAEAAKEGDSVGGIIECAVTGLPAGVGSPLFNSLESDLASLLFSIPAVKGVSFGAGFEAAFLRGSENNDPFYMDNGQVRTKTNRHGGILGGISSGMPLIFTTAFKPTPSIAKPQATVDFVDRKDVTIQVTGRHDPCIVYRAVPCVEAAAAIGLLNRVLEDLKYE